MQARWHTMLKASRKDGRRAEGRNSPHQKKSRRQELTPPEEEQKAGTHPTRRRAEGRNSPHQKKSRRQELTPPEEEQKAGTHPTRRRAEGRNSPHQRLHHVPCRAQQYYKKKTTPTNKQKMNKGRWFDSSLDVSCSLIRLMQRPTNVSPKPHHGQNAVTKIITAICVDRDTETGQWNPIFSLVQVLEIPPLSQRKHTISTVATAENQNNYLAVYKQPYWLHGLGDWKDVFLHGKTVE